MNCVYELIGKSLIKGVTIDNSEGLFSTKEKASEVKEHLEKYNQDKVYSIIRRVVM